MEEGLISYHLFVSYFLFNFAIYVVYPVITDFTMEALCPQKDECSLAIYLTGFQQAITGLGSVFAMPLIGNLSDLYGRKPLLSIPFTSFIIPLAILAYSRTTPFVYAFYVTKTLSGIVENSTQCLALAYVADNVSKEKRGSMFGVVIGVGSAGTLAGTLASRFLPTAKIYLIAAIVSVVAAVYLQLFVKDKSTLSDPLSQPIMKAETHRTRIECESSKEIQAFTKITSFRIVIDLLKSSKTLTLAAFVTFFDMLAFGGLQSSLFYYLKAVFQFNKDQFAEIMLIVYISATITQLCFIPIISPVMGDKLLLSFGLFTGFLMMLLHSIAWVFWVPFAAALLSLFYCLSLPSFCSIVSKQVGKNDQGMAQGSMLSIASLANSVSPLIYSPLTALFLSDGAPFSYPGFSMLCIGLAWLIAFIASTMIPAVTRDDIVTTDNSEA